MNKVHGLDKFRNIIEKKLVYDNKGVWLNSSTDKILLEKNLEVWKHQYQPKIPAEGYFTAFFHLTNDCNKNCNYCYEKDLLVKHPGNNTLEDFISNIKEFVPDDTRGYGYKPYKEYYYDGVHPMIRFVGGEPTMFKNLDKLVYWIVNNTNNKVHIYTNGIKLQNPEYIKKFPKSNQINWALSIDHETKSNYIRTFTENIEKFGGGQEYSYGVLLTCNTTQKMLKIDKICREYQPQEMRYRGISDQLKGKYFPMLSQIIKFICKSRNLDFDYYLNNAKFHQQCLSSLKFNKTDNHNTGNIVTAILPMWRTLIVEEAIKYGSLVVNTKYLNNSTETHCVSGQLYKWRMKHPKTAFHNGLKPVWGKINGVFNEK